MENLFIEKRHASSEVIDRSYVEEQGLRLFRNSPEDLTLQIRTHTPKQGRMSIVHLTKNEALLLAETLTKLAAELQDRETKHDQFMAKVHS